MVNFEPDKESILSAEKLSSRFMNDLRTILKERAPCEVQRELFSGRRYAEQAEEVPINDVVHNMQQMAVEFAIVQRWGGKILCLKLDDGGIAPISISGLFRGPEWSLYGYEDWVAGDWIDYWEKYGPHPSYRYLQKVLLKSRHKKEEFIFADFSETEDSVEGGLMRFLSYRIAGMKKWREWIQGTTKQLFRGSKRPPRGTGSFDSEPLPPPAVGSGGGLQVQVSCLTHGLRIHIAPAFFISWVFFGSPTTPVSGYVLPGRYVFAGDGPMLPKWTQDPGVFSIPPTFNPVLTRF